MCPTRVHLRRASSKPPRLTPLSEQHPRLQISSGYRSCGTRQRRQRKSVAAYCDRIRSVACLGHAAQQLLCNDRVGFGRSGMGCLDEVRYPEQSALPYLELGNLTLDCCAGRERSRSWSRGLVIGRTIPTRMIDEEFGPEV